MASIMISEPESRDSRASQATGASKRFRESTHLIPTPGGYKTAKANKYVRRSLCPYPVGRLTRLFRLESYCHELASGDRDAATDGCAGRCSGGGVVDFQQE